MGSPRGLKMRNQAITRKSAGQVRNVRGQALVESACGLVVITIVFVLLVGFGINTYAALTFGTKLQIVAMETARVLDDERLWLGVQRPDYEASVSQQKAETVGAVVADKLGLDGKSVTFAFEEVGVKNGDEELGRMTVVTASIGLAKLPFELGVFPTGIPVSATAASARGTVQPYAVCDIDAPIKREGGATGPKDGVRIPVYGFFRRTGLGEPQTITTGDPNLPPGGPSEGAVLSPAPDLGFPAAFTPKNFRGLPLHVIENFGTAGGSWFAEARANNKDAIIK